MAFLWRTMTGMERRLDKRIDRLEGKVDGLAKDPRRLAGEVTEFRRSLAGEVRELRGSLAEEMAEIRERLARLEGLFEGFIRRVPPAEAPAAE